LVLKSNSGFGDKSETISSALGRRIDNDLALSGWFWYGFLYAVDYKNWNNGGHYYGFDKRNRRTIKHKNEQLQRKQ
jgi:hypothetical protein